MAWGGDQDMWLAERQRKGDPAATDALREILKIGGEAPMQTNTMALTQQFTPVRVISMQPHMQQQQQLQQQLQLQPQTQQQQPQQQFAPALLEQRPPEQLPQQSTAQPAMQTSQPAPLQIAGRVSPHMTLPQGVFHQGQGPAAGPQGSPRFVLVAASPQSTSLATVPQYRFVVPAAQIAQSTRQQQAPAVPPGSDLSGHATHLQEKMASQILINGSPISSLQEFESRSDDILKMVTEYCASDLDESSAVPLFNELKRLFKPRVRHSPAGSREGSASNSPHRTPKASTPGRAKGRQLFSEGIATTPRSSPKRVSRQETNFFSTNPAFECKFPPRPRAAGTRVTSLQQRGLSADFTLDEVLRHASVQWI